MVLAPDVKRAISYNLKELLSKEKLQEFLDYIESLDFEIEPMNMIWGFGFANDKLYIDFRKCHIKDGYIPNEGEYTLMVLLHEIGHMIRIMENNKKLFHHLDTVESFDEFFETVMKEEKYAEGFAEKKFEEILGYPMPYYIKSTIPEVTHESYKDIMRDVFQKKQEYGSWVKFLHEYEKAGEENFDWILD